MKCPSRSLIDKLGNHGDIFYDFPEVYGSAIEKYLDMSQWDEYHQHMRGYKRQVEKMSSMLYRLIEHLEDWGTPKIPEEIRNTARYNSIIGMLVFVPVLIDFCSMLRTDDGNVGEYVARKFDEYIETFTAIWNSSVDASAECPYPKFMPTAAEFEPHLEFFYDFVEEMKTIAEEDYCNYTNGVYMHLYRLNEAIVSCENKSLLDRQYIEHGFAWKLQKVVPEVKMLWESMTESGFKNEDLVKLLELLQSAEEKYRECDKFFEEEAERVFGKKVVRLTVK